MDVQGLLKASLRYGPAAAGIIVPSLVLPSPYSTGLQLATVAAAIGAEVSDFYLPARGVRRFRKRYLDNLTNSWISGWLANIDEKERTNLKNAIRFCLFDIRRPWTFLFLVRVFERAWRGNFTPGQRDGVMFMCAHQGVAGRAVKERTFIFSRLLPYSTLPVHEQRAARARHRMWGWQLRRTEHISAILSVPVFKPPPEDGEGSGKEPILCVINIDAVSKEAADLLETHYQQMGEEIAKLAENLALLRV